MVETVYEYYCEKAPMGEKLGDTINRIGLEVFRNDILARFEANN